MKIRTYNRDQLINSEEELHSLNIYESGFSLEQGACQYQNQVNLGMNQKMGNQDCKLQIKNKVCSVKEEGLQKVTIIRLKNIQVKIRDYYKFQSNMQVKPQVKQQRNKQLFRKSLMFPNIFKKGKKMTKNLAKNFIKAFFNYLAPLQEIIDGQLQEKIRIIENKKYNNTLIKEITRDEQLLKLFKDFLQNHARDWIEKSKIKDKQLHLGAIRAFQSLIRDKMDISVKSQQVYDQSNNFLDQQFLNYQYFHDNYGNKINESLDQISLVADAGNSANVDFD